MIYDRYGKLLSSRIIEIIYDKGDNIGTYCNLFNIINRFSLLNVYFSYHSYGLYYIHLFIDHSKPCCVEVALKFHL